MRTVGLKVHVCPGTLLLAVTEVAVFVAILLNGVAFISDRNIALDGGLPIKALIAAVVFVFTMWVLGAYDRRYATNVLRNRGRLLIASVIISLAFWLVAFRQSGAGSPFPEAPSLLTSTSLVLAAFVGVVVVRVAFGRGYALAGPVQRILVLGTGGPAARIENIAGRDGQPGFTIAGFLAATSEPCAVKAADVISTNEPIPDLATRLNVGEIVVALTNPTASPTQSLWECRLRGLKVTDYRTFCEREAGTLELDALDSSWLVYSEGFAMGALNHAKRAFDLVVSIMFLIFILPLALATAIAIRLDSSGPIFHRQVRVGRNGTPFVMYKFRSMFVDSEHDGIARWAANNDRRITRVGYFLRRLHIDEIPQVVNVLRGDMSFIGPRPERPSFVDQLAGEIPHYGERHRVRPGITGWAQVNYQYGASVEDARQKLGFDLYYIKNYSLALDFLILLRTIQAVLWPVGVR
jgi:sugar transferase (PEP-CTERM system associated)